jgi:hypothetical protein
METTTPIRFATGRPMAEFRPRNRLVSVLRVSVLVIGGRCVLARSSTGQASRVGSAVGLRCQPWAAR